MNRPDAMATDEKGALVLLVPAARLAPGTDASSRARAAEAADGFTRTLAVISDAAARTRGRVLVAGAGSAAVAWSEGAAGSAAACSVAAVSAVREVEAMRRGALQSLRVAAGYGSFQVVPAGEREQARIGFVLGPAVLDAAQALERDRDAPVAVSARLGAEAMAGADSGGEPRSHGEAEASPATREAGRSWDGLVRRATVMAVRLEVRLDRTEDVREIVDRVTALLQREVARSDGEVLASIPLGTAPSLLCAFGVGQGQAPYHVARAVEAALRLRRAAPREGAGVRIGVATGPVSWRPPVPGAEPALVAGDPVLGALALAASDAGAIVCDVGTREECGDLHRFEVATVDGEACWVVAGAAPAPGDVVARTDVTWFGREAELGWLRDRVLDSDAASRATVVVADAGVGKTALVARLVDEARARGRVVWFVTGDPVAPDEPFGAWRALARSAIDARTAKAGGEIPAIRALAQELGQEVDLAPLFAAVADISMAETARSASLSQAARGAATERMLAALVGAGAVGERPLIVFDDAHWIDESSLRVVSRILETAMVFDLVLLSRPTSRGGAWSRIVEAAGEELRLPELDPPAVARLVGDVAGAVVSDSAADWLRSVAGGNPLFLRELLHDAVQRGTLRVVSGRLERTSVEVFEGDLASLEAVVERRVAALPDDERTVLCCASVLGARFEAQELRPLVPSRVAGAAGERALDSLVDHGLLDRDGEGSDTLRFHHELVRLAAYAMLPERLRRDLHHLVAERLAAGVDAGASSRDALLGHHWERAGRPDAAAGHYAAAAGRAFGRGGGVEGISLYTLALRADDASTSPAPSLERATWESDLSGAFWSVGDMRSAEDFARRALARAGDPLPDSAGARARRMAADAVRIARWWRGAHADPPPAELERRRGCMVAARRLADSQYFTGDSTALLGASLAATAHALRCKDLAPASRAAGLVAYTAGLVGLRRFSEALFARSLAAAQSSGEISAMTGIIGAETMMRVGQGDWARALPLAERALLLCRSGLDTHDIGTALTLLGLANYFRGDFAPAAAAFEELREMAIATRRTQHRAWAGFALSQTMLPRGLAGEAVPMLAEAIELLVDLADNVSLMICRAVQAAAFVRLGDLDGAERSAREAARLSATTAPRNFGSVEGYAGPVEVFLALAHASPAGSASRARWLAEAGRALPALAKYAQLFPIGRPRLHLARGWRHSLAGRSRSARRSWKRALREARALSARYDELRVLLALQEPGADAAARGALPGAADLDPHPLVI